MPLTSGGVSYDLHGPEGAPALLFINSIGATRELWDRQRETLTTAFERGKEAYEQARTQPPGKPTGETL